MGDAFFQSVIIGIIGASSFYFCAFTATEATDLLRKILAELKKLNEKK